MTIYPKKFRNLCFSVVNLQKISYAPIGSIFLETAGAPLHVKPLHGESSKLPRRLDSKPGSCRVGTLWYWYTSTIFNIVTWCYVWKIRHWPFPNRKHPWICLHFFSLFAADARKNLVQFNSYWNNPPIINSKKSEDYRWLGSCAWTQLEPNVALQMNADSETADKLSREWSGFQDILKTTQHWNTLPKTRVERQTSLRASISRKTKHQINQYQPINGLVGKTYTGNHVVFLPLNFMVLMNIFPSPHCTSQ